MRKHDRMLLPPLTAPTLKPVHTRHREDPAHPDANTCTCWRWASLPDVTEGCEGTAMQKTLAREQCMHTSGVEDYKLAHRRREGGRTNAGTA